MEDTGPGLGQYSIAHNVYYGKSDGTRITHLVAQVELKKEQIARTRERTRERIEREERELMDRTLREAQMAAGG